jgi:hypothetical protein
MSPCNMGPRPPDPKRPDLAGDVDGAHVAHQVAEAEDHAGVLGERDRRQLREAWVVVRSAESEVGDA